MEQEVLKEEQEVDLEEEKDGAMERVQGWIETQLEVPREEPQPEEEKPPLEPEREPHSEDSQPKPLPQVRQYDDQSLHLDPRAQEFRPRHYRQEVPATASIYHNPLEEMIRMLQMPKTEMITFDGDLTEFWTFIKAFENNIGKYRVDEHAKLARLLQ